MKNLWKKIRPGALRVANWFRAGVATALVTFGVTFIGTLTTWLQAVLEWSSRIGHPDGAVEFPSPDLVVSGAISLTLAVLIGGVTAVIRGVQTHYEIGKPPIYPTQQKSR